MNSSIYTAHSQQGLLLNANENPENISAELLGEIQAALPEILFNRYPEDEALELRQAYARYLGISPEMIMAGNGSDQMLQLLISAFAGPGRDIFTFAPDFGMYDFYAASYGANVRKYPLSVFEDIDLEDLIASIQELQPALVLFSNPNNPTGIMLDAGQMKTLADAIAPIPLVADEAYMEFGQNSVLPYLDETPNLYITRTLSKAFGLAGLRVGFLISRSENIAELLPYKIVYNLSTIAQKIAAIALNHTDEYEKQVQRIIAERDRMKKALDEMEIVSGPANANYLCVFVPDSKKLGRMFEEQNIQVRTYESQPYLRITVGRPEDNDKVIEIIKKYKMQKGDVQ